MSEIGSRVALCVIGYCLIADLGKQVFPLCISVSIYRAVLGLDVAVVVIGHCIDNRAVFLFGKQLTERVVGIFGYAVNAVRDLGYSLFGIVFVGNGSAARIGYLAYELGRRAGFQLFSGSVFFGDVARIVTELSRNEPCSELQFLYSYYIKKMFNFQ